MLDCTFRSPLCECERCSRCTAPPQRLALLKYHTERKWFFCGFIGIKKSYTFNTQVYMRLTGQITRGY